jgi:hypothetical protein
MTRGLSPLSPAVCPFCQGSKAFEQTRAALASWERTRAVRRAGVFKKLLVY